MITPILFAEKNCAYCNNGSFIMGYKLVIPEIFSLSKNSIETTHKLWQSVIKRLPEGCFIHRFDAYINNPYNTNVLPDRTYFQKSYKNHFEQKIQLLHHGYVFFGITEVKALSELLVNPFAKTNLNQTITEQDWININFRSIIESEASFINKSSSFKCVSLTTSEMQMFSYEFFNLFTSSNSTTIDFSNEIKIDETSISVTVGDKMIGVLSLYDEKQLPNELSTIVKDPLIESKQGFETSLGDLFGIYARKPHYLSTVIFRDSRKEWLTKLSNTEQTYRRYSFMSSFFNEKAKDIAKIHAELQSEYNEELIVRSNTTLIFWGDDKTDFVNTKQYFGNIFREADILASAPVGKHLKNLFVTANPFYSGLNSELNVYPASSFAPLSFFPLVTNYTNDDNGLFFCDRFNLPFKMDIWDEKKLYLRARNFIMLAPTGEGKSFFLQELLRQMYESNCTLVIIDLGKSFKKFAQVLGNDAAFIEFENGKPFSINPFNRPIEELLSSDKLNSLSHFVYAHIDVELKESHNIFMRKLLKFYIETSKSSLSFKSFILFIRDTEETIKKKFAGELEFVNLGQIKINLSEFIDDGVYAYLYEEQVEAKLSDSLRNKKVAIFEIAAAQSNTKIINVLLQTIQDTIHTNIWSDKTRKGIVLFEEFAQLLKKPNVMANVEFYYQAIRKQEGGIGIVLQNSSQIPENTTSDSLFDNAQIIYALYNKAGYDKMLSRLSIESEHSLSLLNSLKNNFSGPQKYSEVYIKHGDRERVVRLDVSREQYLSFITDGSEQAALTKLTNNGVDIISAIEQLK